VLKKTHGKDMLLCYTHKCKRSCTVFTYAVQTRWAWQNIVCI